MRIAWVVLLTCLVRRCRALAERWIPLSEDEARFRRTLNPWLKESRWFLVEWDNATVVRNGVTFAGTCDVTFRTSNTVIDKLSNRFLWALGDVNLDYSCARYDDAHELLDVPANLTLRGKVSAAMGIELLVMREAVAALIGDAIHQACYAPDHPILFRFQGYSRGGVIATVVGLKMAWDHHACRKPRRHPDSVIDVVTFGSPRVFTPSTVAAIKAYDWWERRFTVRNYRFNEDLQSRTYPGHDYLEAEAVQGRLSRPPSVTLNTSWPDFPAPWPTRPYPTVPMEAIKLIGGLAVVADALATSARRGTLCTASWLAHGLYGSFFRPLCREASNTSDANCGEWGMWPHIKATCPDGLPWAALRDFEDLPQAPAGYWKEQIPLVPPPLDA